MQCNAMHLSAKYDTDMDLDLQRMFNRSDQVRIVIKE